MKITTSWTMNLKTKEAEDKVKKAARLGMRDTVVDIQGDTIKNARAVGFWETGNNARSIAGEVSGMGKVAGEGSQERVVDDGKIEGAIYSTSGYGGYGETGTVHMAARPYFRPALDKNIKNLPRNIKAYL